MISRWGASAAWSLLAVAMLSPLEAFGQAHFLPATDANLRADLLLLADEGVIELPANAWPIPAADVIDKVERVDVDSIAAAGLQAALLRVRRIVERSEDSAEWRSRELRISAGRPAVLRAYDSIGREELEVQALAGASTPRWSVALSATAAGSPQDGHRLRLDGSSLSVQWGNWLFSANQLERWWGPGWDGSLILSTNARPMPGVSLDRVRSESFDLPVLRWLGPWRFSAFLARAERRRPDVDESLFMGMRLSIKPAQILEFGLSRTAQFCGRRRPCDFVAFRNVLFGDDNTGLRVAPEDEPGNQMAGADVRLVSPVRGLPFALYGQFIGEDNSSSGIPERYLGLLGFESWLLMPSGTMVRWQLEYANTSCKFASPGENPDCGYRQAIFRAGYQFHGRNIGHTADSDAESIGARVLVQSGDSSMSIRARRTRLDRYGRLDPFNPLTLGPGKHEEIEAQFNRSLGRHHVGVAVGYERLEAGAADGRSGPVGAVQWRMKL